MNRSGLDRIEGAIGRIESSAGWDTTLNMAVKAVATPQQIAGPRSQTVRDFLHGVWLGHPLHPMLVALPIGTWTMALGLDALGAIGGLRNRTAEQASEIALTTGALGAVAAAMAGVVDWQRTHGRDRRTGMVHGLINTTALALTLASLRLRSQGRRGSGRVASALGWSCMAAGGYLGAHMVYRRKVGVDQADRSPAPRDFTPVLQFSELEEGRPRKVEILDEAGRPGADVVLVKRNGHVHALGARCSHMGGPLESGWVVDGALVCPWHGSSYDLETGQPVHGPSTCAQPRYHVRVRNGVVELKHQREPGEETVAPDDLMRVDLAEPVTNDPAPYGRTAVEVLSDHHQQIRGLLRKVVGMSPNDPERGACLRAVAMELDIHEVIEEKIFYPAVTSVSETVAVAYAEHNELDDLLATVMRIGVSSPEFEPHIQAMQAALEHHAGSEERVMFVEAQRLGERRLRQLGRQLSNSLESQRTSRLQRAYRDLKAKILEGA